MIRKALTLKGNLEPRPFEEFINYNLLSHIAPIILDNMIHNKNLL
jgi:hypothetical protein